MDTHTKYKETITKELDEISLLFETMRNDVLKSPDFPSLSLYCQDKLSIISEKIEEMKNKFWFC